MSANSANPKHTNKLAQEKSPYLLQHQHNPVDWLPWGEEAFAKARAENKPIFLSIGYSTCHWCHVMERESFENEAVGAFLNQHFVSIKVDREERPDVDKIYMTAAQAMNEGGGWPLNVFLTPHLVPFFSGTYFPPEPKYGRASFMQVLQQLAELWKTRQIDIEKSSAQIHEQLKNFTRAEAAPGLGLAPAVIHKAVAIFKRQFDPRHGGFGRAPKFPRPTEPSLLLWHGVLMKDQEAVDMVLHTCKMMAAGGMCDQLGGGFARYSVDEKWLVPHFEKMLYDNAQLVHLYLDAYLVSEDDGFAQVAHETLQYILRDMTHPEGGFFSAEDADSEGKEGKFYNWTKSELQQLLTPEEFVVVSRYYGITEKGNFVDHSDPDPLPNQNVLSIVDPDLSEEETILFNSGKVKMFQARTKRIRPHLDDKALTSWNGLMLGAMARAAAVFQNAVYLAAAEKNAAFLKNTLWDANTKTLGNRWRDGHKEHVQLLDAYANLMNGILELYQATLKPEYLEFALALAESMMERFYDHQEGGFWQSDANDSNLILRLKDDYDGAEPSGNSSAILGLLKLAAICDRNDFRQAAEKTLRLFAERMQQLPQAVPLMLAGLQFWLSEPRRVVLTGIPRSPDVAKLLHAAHSVYQPHKIILGTAGPVEPFAKTLPDPHGKAMAYVCAGTECKPPTAMEGKLQQMLGE
ncbi:MAG: thioredoxin domain-containing protein [Verrucomicrobiales bacterium]